MTVRITLSADGERTVLQIAGRLGSADVSIMDDEIRSVGGGLVIDLTELTAADEAGIKRLRELASGRAVLQGASGYVRTLLDSNGT